MREILFKAKRKDNGELVEGFLFHCLNNGEEWCIGKEPLSANDYSEIIGEYITWFAIDENTICQYTGLTDKNGNKIWENDVCRQFADIDELGNSLYFYYQIKWDEKYARFYGEEIYSKETFLFDDLEDIEVIGNIFDNPELLEGGAE